MAALITVEAAAATRLRSRSLLWSLVYLAVRRVLGLVPLRLRGRGAKEIEILVLRHQLDVLRRQHPRTTAGASQPGVAGRAEFVSRPVGGGRWCVRPETILHRHRRLVVWHRTYPKNRKGGRRYPTNFAQLIVGSLGRTRPDATSGSRRTARPRPPSRQATPYEKCYVTVDSTRPHGAPRRPGRRSCANKRPGWSAATSSRSASGACTCCSSYTTSLGKCPSLGSPPTRPGRGYPTSPQPVGRASRYGSASAVCDP